MTSFFKEIPPYYEHQETTLDLLRAESRVLDLSDSGTAKTRPALGAYIERLNAGGKRCLVLTPQFVV